MKKLILAVSAIMLLLCACTPKSNDSCSQEIASHAEASKSPNSDIYITHGGEERVAAELYEYTLKAVLFSGEWSDDSAECEPDFKIRLLHENKELEYSSTCGTLLLDGKSKQLSDYDKANLNEYLFSLFEIE